MKKGLRLVVMAALAMLYGNSMYAQEDAVYEDITIKKKTYHIAVSGAADLGLSVKWAACNIGAEKPEDDGEYFAWGEKEDKQETSFYDGQSYFDLLDTGYRYFNKYSLRSRKEQLDDEDDVAHVKLGGTWHMPTKAEANELVDKCKFKWITFKGKKGCIFIGKTGNAIFFPAAGYIKGTYIQEYTVDGGIWTKTRHRNPTEAYVLRYSNWGNTESCAIRFLGFNVRPVTK